MNVLGGVKGGVPVLILWFTTFVSPFYCAVIGLGGFVEISTCGRLPCFAYLSISFAPDLVEAIAVGFVFSFF